MLQQMFSQVLLTAMHRVTEMKGPNRAAQPGSPLGTFSRVCAPLAASGRMPGPGPVLSLLGAVTRPRAAVWATQEVEATTRDIPQPMDGQHLGKFHLKQDVNTGGQPRYPSQKPVSRNEGCHKVHWAATTTPVASVTDTAWKQRPRYLCLQLWLER